MKRIVIIGGGIAGLSAAQRLLHQTRDAEEQIEVTLLEAGDRTGGIIQTRERDGFLLESGPDSFISEKPAALLLSKSLGLEPRLIETNASHRRSFVVRQGKLLPVPEGFQLMAPGRLWPFLQSDIFSWSGKARMAMELLLPRRTANGEVKDESLGDFVRRRLGREALERMAQPMVAGIYTADPDTLSLKATLPRFLEMEREHGSVIRALRKQNRSPTVREGSTVSEASGIVQATSGARYSLFLSFDRGMQVLTDRLTEVIADARADCIQLNTRVESLALDLATSDHSGCWKITTDRNETIAADAICLALPSFISSHLLRDVHQQLASELDNIPYASTATINLAYKRDDIPHPLDGFGFVVPFIEKRSLLACTFSSVKFAGRAPAGFVLLRAFVGGALQPEMFSLAEAELITRVRNDLRELLGIRQPPLFAEVSRWESSMPQYHVGHVERVERIRELASSLPRLAFAGNAYSGPGIPDCIRTGETAAADLLGMLGKTPARSVS